MKLDRREEIVAKYHDTKAKRKAQIIDFIRQYRDDHSGLSPTYAEIAEGLGLNVNSARWIQSWVNELIDEGWLRKLPDVPQRNIVPVEPPPAKEYPT